MGVRSAAKVPLKRLIGLWKGVRLRGRAYVSPSAKISGRGRVDLGDESRLNAGSRVRVRRLGSLSIGDRTVVSQGALIFADDGNVIIGDDCALVFYSLIYGEAGVTLGNRVMVGNHSLISSVDHTYECVESVFRQPMRRAPVSIGDDVWIGGHCIILAGVRIGEGAIVASHSLVKHDVPPFAIVGGAPARVLRMRTEG